MKGLPLWLSKPSASRPAVIVGDQVGIPEVFLTFHVCLDDSGGKDSVLQEGFLPLLEICCFSPRGLKQMSKHEWFG